MNNNHNNDNVEDLFRLCFLKTVYEFADISIFRFIIRLSSLKQYETSGVGIT